MSRWPCNQNFLSNLSLTFPFPSRFSPQIQSTVPRTWTLWTSVPVSWPCSGRPLDTRWHAATVLTWPSSTSMCSTSRSLLLRSWYRPPLITLWGDSGLSWRSDYGWCWPTLRAARRARRSSNRQRKTVSLNKQDGGIENKYILQMLSKINMTINIDHLHCSMHKNY